MSYIRKIKRAQKSNGQQHVNTLATLLGNFYEFLSKQPKPCDEEVRKMFTSNNAKWKKYCTTHKLMNMNHLFVLNVKEAWARHTSYQNHTDK